MPGERPQSMVRSGTVSRHIRSTHQVNKMEEIHLKGKAADSYTGGHAIENGQDHDSANGDVTVRIRSSQDFFKGNDTFTVKLLKTTALYISFVGMASTFPVLIIIFLSSTVLGNKNVNMRHDQGPTP